MLLHILVLGPHKQKYRQRELAVCRSYKEALVTANVQKDNEGRPGRFRQRDNRKIMTSVVCFGL